MKYLYCYTLNEFKEFVELDLKTDNWWIYNDTIENRYSAIINKDYFKILNQFAKQDNINYGKEEIISWLDNISILYSALQGFYDDTKRFKEFLEETLIIGELHIPFSRHRADIVLMKDNKILIIELSFAKKEKRESRYQEKLNQVICYKELLSNALPKHVEIATYTFPIQPETDENGNSIFKYSPIAKEDKFLNYDNCSYLGQFIKQFFATTNQSAFDELNKIKDDFIIKINKKKKESSKSFTSNNNYYNDLPF